MPAEQWTPLLQGVTQQEALRVVANVAHALRGPPSTGMDPSVSGGSAGTGLLFAYLQSVQDIDEATADDYAETAVAHLEHAVGNLTAHRGPSLYSGMAGVFWAVQHVSDDDGLLDPGDTEDLLQTIDEKLLDLLSEGPWQRHCDLIVGLVGYGVYFLERLPASRAKSALETIVNHLEARVECLDGGLSWKTPPELLPAWQLENAPHGYYSLGLAHGVSGIIALLGELCAQKIEAQCTTRLLEGAVTWMLAQRLTPGAGSVLPSWVGPQLAPEPSRLAWCNGDLGLATALLLAARRVGNDVWEHEAVEIARAAAARRLQNSGVKDAGLCHGAAGNGHLFNRLFQATGIEAFREAAVYWFEQALQMHRPGEGVGGYLSYSPKQDGEPTWTPDAGFLTGAAGVALALLSAASPLAPDWDRLMLVNLPHPSSGNQVTCR